MLESSSTCSAMGTASPVISKRFTSKGWAIKEDWRKKSMCPDAYARSKPSLRNLVKTILTDDVYVFRVRFPLARSGGEGTIHEIQLRHVLRCFHFPPTFLRTIVFPCPQSPPQTKLYASTA